MTASEEFFSERPDISRASVTEVLELLNLRERPGITLRSDSVVALYHFISGVLACQQDDVSWENWDDLIEFGSFVDAKLMPEGLGWWTAIEAACDADGSSEMARFWELWDDYKS